MTEKKEIPGKVKRNGRKFEIFKGNAAGEIDLTIELSEDGNYTVEKLDVEVSAENHARAGWQTHSMVQ
jgi:hypothetical protein